MSFFCCCLERVLIAELAEHSPIIIQNSSNPSSQKNLVVRLYDCTTVQLYKVLLLTCVVNYTTGTPMPRLCPVVQWSVHWAPSWTTRVLVLAGARLCALETSREKKKKNCELHFQAWLNLYITLIHESDQHLISPNNITPKQTLESHEDKGNAHQLKKL